MRLAERFQEWEANQGQRTRRRLQQITAARANLGKLFLGNRLRGIADVRHWVGNAHRKFAEETGVERALPRHQMRRLYAYSFERHRLDGLLFRKERFKYSSINMTSYTPPARTRTPPSTTKFWRESGYDRLGQGADCSVRAEL